jgi:hypothetical protein
MSRLVACALALAAAFAATSSAGQVDAAAAHPCQLISNREVSRILARSHVEVGGSTCRVHRGTPMVGVITINPDTRARFATFRRALAANGRVTGLRGLGESAFLHVYPKMNAVTYPRHTVFVLQRGHRLLVTSFGASLTPARARSIAAVVAPRI